MTSPRLSQRPSPGQSGGGDDLARAMSEPAGCTGMRCRAGRDEVSGGSARGARTGRGEVTGGCRTPGGDTVVLSSADYCRRSSQLAPGGWEDPRQARVGEGWADLPS